jgi:hypothetical protein
MAGGLLVVVGLAGVGGYSGYHYGVPETETAGHLTGWAGARRGAMMWGTCCGLPCSAAGILFGGACGWLVRFRDARKLKPVFR